VLASIGDQAPELVALAHHVVQLDNPCSSGFASVHTEFTNPTPELLRLWKRCLTNQNLTFATFRLHRFFKHDHTLILSGK